MTAEPSTPLNCTCGHSVFRHDNKRGACRGINSYTTGCHCPHVVLYIGSSNYPTERLDYRGRLARRKPSPASQYDAIDRARRDKVERERARRERAS